MNVLLVDELSRTIKIKISSFVPRVGDEIDGAYNPLPSVKAVIAYPSERTVLDFGFQTNLTVDAVVVF